MDYQNLSSYIQLPNYIPQNESASVFAPPPTYTHNTYTHTTHKGIADWESKCSMDIFIKRLHPIENMIYDYELIVFARKGSKED